MTDCKLKSPRPFMGLRLNTYIITREFKAVGWKPDNSPGVFLLIYYMNHSQVFGSNTVMCIWFTMIIMQYSL